MPNPTVAAFLLSVFALQACSVDSEGEAPVAADIVAEQMAAVTNTVVPSDAKPTCSIDQTAFNTWFQQGSAAQNGLVSPANGFNFPPSSTNTKCDFYKWGAQMFLWLASPSEGGFVFDSDVFYDIVPVGTDSSGKPVFEFMQSNSNTPNVTSLRTVKGDEDITGTGQAGGSDVLISQGESLTYYGIHANDIYAQYRTGFLQGKFADTPIAGNFPTTEADVALIAKFAGTAFADENAMTMELKTSWVDSSTVNADDFIVIDALVPAYDKSSETLWTLKSEPEAMRLAMVGMHIVAPVLGHPELVWITYEHIGNAPNAEYYYTNTSNVDVAVPFRSAGTWTFLPTNAAMPGKITTVASVKNGDIVAASGEKISAVNDMQKNPWGVDPGPNSDVANNTDLVSLNSSLIALLRELDDLRANYYQIGGIWTVDGQLPTGGTDSNIRGGTRLANSTMETFHQYPDENNGFRSENCFFCHNVGSNDADGVDLSHIFNDLRGL